jgi:hypothetical protein
MSSFTGSSSSLSRVPALRGARLDIGTVDVPTTASVIFRGRLIERTSTIAIIDTTRPLAGNETEARS